MVSNGRLRRAAAGRRGSRWWLDLERSMLAGNDESYCAENAGSEKVGEGGYDEWWSGRRWKMGREAAMVGVGE